MHICHLDPLFIPYAGGAEKVVYEVSRRLTDRHKISVLTSRLPKTKARERMANIDVKRVSPSIYLEKMPAVVPPPFTIVPFFNYSLLKEEGDLFHIHNRFWYYYGTMLTLKLLKRKKLAMTLHNALPKGISFSVDYGALAYDLLVGRRWMELSNVIIAVSEYTRDVTVPKRLHHKVHVVHNGVDVKKFDPKKSGAGIRKKLGIHENAFVVLENARLVEQKGYKYLLEAFAMLKKAHKESELVIIGRGPLKGRILQHASKLGISKSVRIVTGIPESQLPLYYRAADIFAHSAVWEPCAVVNPEALASGLPITAFNIGGNPEQIRSSYGVLTEPRNSAALHEGMEYLYDNDKEGKKFGIKARERAVKDFAWEVVADRWDSAYQSVK